ncbi:MAG: hypothetical protein H0T05_01025 [Acidobacteria bacterium]|nr:hypothetical protein [Acidobacteriota bacterium]
MILRMNHDERPDGITRVLSLPLPEAEWRALLAIEPEPVAWLREQIRDRLQEDAGSGAQAHRLAGVGDVAVRVS